MQDETVLHQAALDVHVKSAELLLLSGAELNARNEDGKTPLHYAASAGQAQMVRFLLDKQPDELLLNSEGKELVAVAATRIQLPSSEEQRMKNARYIEVVRILSARGAEVDIHSATAIGDADYVEKLLKRDPSLGGSSDGRGVPVFQRVVWLNNKKILVMFLDHGVDVDLTEQENPGKEVAANRFALIWFDAAGLGIADARGVTFLNDARLPKGKRFPLKADDVLRFGKTVLRVRVIVKKRTAVQK